MTMIENWCLLQNKLNFNDEYDANQKDWGHDPSLNVTCFVIRRWLQSSHSGRRYGGTQC